VSADHPASRILICVSALSTIVE